MLQSIAKDHSAKPPLAFITSADGGLAHYVTHLWALAERHFEPLFITYANRPVDDLVFGHVPRVERRIDFDDPRSVESVARLCAEQGVRLVNLHIATTAKRQAGYYGSLLERLRAGGARIIETLHDVLPYSTFPVDAGRVRDLISLADGYLIGNEAQRMALAANFIIGSRPVAIAPHGPYTLFDNQRFDPPAARRLFGLPPDAPVILFFGRLRPDKNLELLLRAFVRVRSRLSAAMLFIATDISYTPQYAALFDELADRGARDGILTLKEYNAADKIEPIFRACDVLALPYRCSAQSGVLNLGRAFQLPVVVTDAFAEADEISRCWGRSVPVNDEAALARALGDVLEMPRKERERLGAEGLRLGLERYGWDRNVSALVDMARMLLPEAFAWQNQSASGDAAAPGRPA